MRDVVQSFLVGFQLTYALISEICGGIEVMEFWFHCNSCTRRPENWALVPNYHLTSCGHILCNECFGDIGWSFSLLLIVTAQSFPSLLSQKRHLQIRQKFASFVSELKLQLVQLMRHYHHIYRNSSW